MNAKPKQKRHINSRPTPIEKKTHLSKICRSTKKKQGSSKTINPAETSEKTAEETSVDKKRYTIQTCFENKKIDTIYEDTVSNDSDSDFSISSNRLDCCLICGDDTELLEHKVCFWHAITEKNSLNMPLYQSECDYALIKYGDGKSYLNRVHEKKYSILNKVLSN